jgi:peroxiredoxin
MPGEDRSVLTRKEPEVSKRSIGAPPAEPAAARRNAQGIAHGGRGAIAGLLLLVFLVQFEWDNLRAQVGTRIADFQLADDEGKPHSLEDYAGKILVLEFWSYKCPPSAAYDDRIKELDAKYRRRGVMVLAVDSNKNEPADEVRVNGNSRQLPYPVLMDPSGNLADSLGATHTPSVAVLDGSGVLRYRGAIDNNRRPGESGRIAYLENALDALLSGQPVQHSETRMSGGCTIKR